MNELELSEGSRNCGFQISCLNESHHDFLNAKNVIWPLIVQSLSSTRHAAC